ncbi:quinon protein alcohol dehydrogenase-like superfamily [Gorgonomyces haynaldii]|nr:quinon protein alcohol dehydrogenase-like superfamily [Gorgonomyces haynaldii]
MKSTTFGGTLQTLSPVFSSDTQFLLVGCGARIKCYNIETGLLYNVLETGKTHELTHLQVVGNQVYASADKNLYLWDYNANLLLEVFETESVIHKFLVSDRECFIITKTEKLNRIGPKTGIPEDYTLAQLVKLNLDSRKTQVMYESMNEKLLDLCELQDQLVLVGLNSYMYLSDNGLKRYKSQSKLTCVAGHPTQNMIALGDSIGRIFLAYGNGKSEPKMTEMHWHAHQVNDLCFTGDGVYLLSGGEEAVLVMWQLETGSKAFVPRLGSEIVHVSIAPQHTFYCVGQKDNSIQLISTGDMNVFRTFSGIKAAHLDQKMYPTSVFHLDPINRHLVLNGLPGTLQYYSAIGDHSIKEFDVTNRNRVSKTESKDLRQTHVRFAQHSQDGMWLVTLESRKNDDFDDEYVLKFYQYDLDLQNYFLNTRVDMPHQKDVNSLSLSHGKNGLFCVTTSVDKTFKIYECVQGKTQACWMVRTTHRYNHLVPNSAQFCEDDSFLAVGFGPVLSLWDHRTGQLLHTLSCCATGDDIQKIIFSQQFLITQSKYRLDVWNLLTGSVYWSMMVSLKDIAKDPRTNKFCCVREEGEGGNVCVFDPKSPAPIMIQPLEGKPLHVCYIPTSGDSELIVLDKQFVLHRWSDQTQVQVEPKKQKKSGFGSLLTGPKQVFEKKMDVNNQDFGFFKTPSHILAPPSKMVLSVLRTMLEPKKIVEEQAKTVDMDTAEEFVQPVQSIPDVGSLSKWVSQLVIEHQ